MSEGLELGRARRPTARDGFQFFGRFSGVDVKLGHARFELSKDVDPEFLYAVALVFQFLVDKKIRKNDPFRGEGRANFRVPRVLSIVACDAIRTGSANSTASWR